MGIIDILQTWNWQKRAERFVKALRGMDIDGLSAIEPKQYRRRFVEEMAAHIAQAGDAVSSASPVPTRLSRSNSDTVLTHS